MSNDVGAPVFVKVSEYKHVLDVVDMIKRSISDAKRTLEDLEALKEEEARELDGWKVSIENIDKKVDDINKMMFEPNNW